MSTKTNNDKLMLTIIDLVNSNNYKKAQSELEKILLDKTLNQNFTIRDWQVIGDVALAVGNFDHAATAFHCANNSESAIFAHVLNSNLAEAKNLLSNISYSPASNWSHFLIDLFSDERKFENIPSYLQIRHFLELTVYLLLIINKQDYIEKILKKLKVFLEINNDAEKYIGYAYFHFGDNKQAMKFLNNAIRRNQYDGEIYFVLGQLYEKMNEYTNALAMLENAGLFLPDHYPTKVLKKKVLENISI